MEGITMKDIFRPTIEIKILSKIQQYNFSTLLYRIIVLKGFRHKDNGLLQLDENPILCLPATYKRELFRFERKGSSYKEGLDTYFYCIYPSYSFGNGNSYTKKYRLKA
jgi:hypothetical protein